MKTIQFTIMVIGDKSQLLKYRTLDKAIVEFKKLTKEHLTTDTIIELGASINDMFYGIASNTGDHRENVINHDELARLKKLLERKILETNNTTHYSFYTYSIEGKKHFELFRDAISHLKELHKNNKVEHYLALGVTKNETVSCDLINNLGDAGALRISNDYKQLDNFKDDKLVAINMIKKLERELVA